MKKKVLITSKPLDHEGGVANYYRVFFEKFSSERFELQLSIFGSRTEHFYSRWKTVLFYPFFYCVDYFRFISRILKDRDIRVVQVSPSLMLVPLARDAFIVLGAKLLRRRVIVFFRGWRVSFADTLKRNSIAAALFRFIFNRADQTLVLASHFRDDLVQIGWDPETVQVTTTTFDSSEIEGFIDRSGLRPGILFLGRVSEMKGVGELIDALGKLSARNVDFDCTIVGHEDQKGTLEYFSRISHERGLEEHVTFTGRVTGRRKFELLSSSDLFVLPSWTEGCPNSVLEALGSGLFVVSTDVGALRDVVRPGVNGSIVPVKDSESLARELESACLNIEDIRARRLDRRKDAVEKYEIEVIVRDIENVYDRLSRL